MSNHHPVKRLTTPADGDQDIDVMLSPLLEALWAAGYETIGSCQDVGESTAGSSPRYSSHWHGYVLIEMPVEDACRLLDTVKDTPQFADRMHWAADGAWDVSVPIIAGSGDEPTRPLWAQIHFPSDQIDDLVKVITAG